MPTVTRVSVAMATFNGRDYIDQQLESFLNQTRLPDELIVTDDGSTDGTVERVLDFARRAPFDVRVSVNERRLGYAMNFDRAIGACTGDIVFFSDQDDVWMPRKVESVLAEFELRPCVDVVIHDCLIANANLEHAGATALGNLRRMGRSTDHFVSGCCTAVRRRFLQVGLPIPSVDGHDSWFHGLALLLNVRQVMPVPLIYYRRHGRNHSMTPTSSVAPLNRAKAILHGLARKLGRRSLGRHARSVSVAASRWRAFAHRLRAIKDDPGLLPGVSEATLDRAESVVHRWIGVSQARVQLLALPRHKRIGAVRRAFAHGVYRGFSVPWAILADLTANRGGGVDVQL